MNRKKLKIKDFKTRRLCLLQKVKNGLRTRSTNAKSNYDLACAKFVGCCIAIKFASVVQNVAQTYLF